MEVYENRIEEYSEVIEETKYQIEELAEDLVDERTLKRQQESEKRSKENDET